MAFTIDAISLEPSLLGFVNNICGLILDFFKILSYTVVIVWMDDQDYNWKF